MRDCYVAYLDDIGCPLEDLSCQCTDSLDIYNSHMGAVTDLYTCLAFELCGTFEMADMYTGEYALEYCAPYFAGSQTTRRTLGPTETDDDLLPEETQVETREETGESSLHPGIIAAIVLGIILLALAIVGYMVFYMRRRRKSTTSTLPTTTDHTSVGQQQAEAKDSDVPTTTRPIHEADAYSPKPTLTLSTSTPSPTQSPPSVSQPHMVAPPPSELYAATSPRQGTLYHEMPPHNTASEMAATNLVHEMPSVPHRTWWKASAGRMSGL
ncbi:uncharacterized protein J7T54_005030 [Emericellopsis cladophorae]|uniref:Uncharacterized protein n=1 Tax=Emericellopsis cladophorae TaxID=2686198 RepID=A0A9Q0BBC4_9HYPO|nr:uncharacterized protein J7T54_005030 [Emericellopsis cladophorae]KAI6778506.1 hypothetical protein J7T54_005030 [Emericellopsis cladophorae]